MGALHRIAESPRFDPAQMTAAASDELREASLDHPLPPIVVDRLEGVATLLVHSYPRVGPSRMMWPTTGLLVEATRRARRVAWADERSRLARVVGYVGVVAGHLAFDVGRRDYVAGYFEGALDAIDEAGDLDMRVWALAIWSVVPAYTQAPARAAELLDCAVALARRGPSSTRLAWVLGMRARALAALCRDAEACAALADAYEVLACRPPGTEERDPTDFFDLARLEAVAGSGLLKLGRFREAGEALERAIAARPLSDRKGRALAALELAAARVRENEPEEACGVMAEVVSAEPDVLVVPVVGRAREVASSLQPWASLDAVRDLRERLTVAGISKRTG